ncbi:hypothetical protein EYR36_008479 [Pleurotus pulmonarius]|nr:hypothetical protein EYR36_008479 [Pleurotus pulmonarius]
MRTRGGAPRYANAFHQVSTSTSGQLAGQAASQSIDNAGPLGKLLALLIKFLGLGSVLSSLLPGLGGNQLSSQLSGSLKLFMIGTMVESGRRFWQWVFTRFNPKFSITARFSEGDPIHEWIVLFLTDRKVWHRSRDYFVRYKATTRKWGVTVGAPQQQPPEDKTAAHLEEGIEYVPSFDTPQIFRWNGYWLEVMKDTPKLQTTPQVWTTPRPGSVAGLCLNMYTLKQDALRDFISEAKEHYIETSKQKVIVRSMGGDGGSRMDLWNRVQSKTYRPLESIILPDGVLDAIINDARDFIASEDWYVRAGIPYRRGYLFYGPPGTGKSSTVYALAGELGLEIYTLSLSNDSINDNSLRTSVERIPKRGILLIEDIDCAFPSREDEEERALGQTFPYGNPNPQKRSAVTMSGLLNVLDGVDSEEGKIFMATTNYVDRLDAALMRPGRIDMKIQYDLASQRQAAALFNRFFTSPDEAHAPPGLPYTGTGHHPLADEFAAAVPPEFTIAELQGYLLSCKTRPEAAVAGISAWVASERAERAAREKRERERLLKLAEAKKTREAAAVGAFGQQNAYGLSRSHFGQSTRQMGYMAPPQRAGAVVHEETSPQPPQPTDADKGKDKETAEGSQQGTSTESAPANSESVEAKEVAKGGKGKPATPTPLASSVTTEKKE